MLLTPAQKVMSARLPLPAGSVCGAVGQLGAPEGAVDCCLLQDLFLGKSGIKNWTRMVNLFP